LEGRDVQMTDVHTTQVLEDTHVTLTPVNPNGQQQSSSVSSQFMSNMLNLSPDAGIDSLFESTPWVDVPVMTIVESLLLTAPTLPPPSIHVTPPNWVAAEYWVRGVNDEFHDQEDEDDQDDNDDDQYSNKDVENSDNKGNDDETHGMNVGGDEGPDAEDDDEELYGDVNINLEGRDVQMTDVHTTQGMYHKKNVDFAYLIWEDFVYQVEHKDVKKSNEMYYPRFIKVIVNFFMTKDPSIPRRNKFSTILPVELTNEDIRNSTAYKEYYAIASGAIPPKIKASVRNTQSSSDTTMPPQVAKGKRLQTLEKVDKPAKGKQLVKSSKAKCLTVLFEVALTEAKQINDEDDDDDVQQSKHDEDIDDQSDDESHDDQEGDDDQDDEDDD
nr:hypothetical protein [Tanacetum cinerariifolium]